MKYIFFTWDGISMPIAQRLQEEGQDVVVAQIQDAKELGYDNKSGRGEDTRRLRNYDGILKKYPAKEMLKILPKIKEKDDYFIVFDFNNLWKYGERVAEMGFKNIFHPTKEQFMLERDRHSGKKFVKEKYKDSGLEVAEEQQFSKTEEAIEFLENDGMDSAWVLKSNSDKGETFVPSTPDPEFARQMITSKLLEQKGDYESAGFILERMIPDIKEYTPELVFWNGEPVYATIDIEYKYIGSGDNGQQVGCGNNLIIKMPIDHPIIQKSFPETIYEMARKHKGMFVWDASILNSPSEGCEYFGEFCANRVGWDSVFSEISMSGGPTAYFEAISRGENPLKYKYGVSVRGFNAGEKEDALMIWRDEHKRNIYVYDAYKKRNGWNTSGTGKDLVVFTGASDTVIGAVEEAYTALDNFAFPKMQYRPRHDFMTDEFSSSIHNRFRVVFGDEEADREFRQVEHDKPEEPGVSDDMMDLKNEIVDEVIRRLNDKYNEKEESGTDVG